MTTIEILADAVGAVCAARDTLEQKEEALRGIQPPCSDGRSLFSYTSEDAADYLYAAQDALDDAANTLNKLIKAAKTRRRNGDKDKEVR